MDYDPFERYGGVGRIKDWENNYIVVLQHPVTTEYAESRNHIGETLKAVHELNMPTFWFWPNVDAGSDGTSKGIRSFREHNSIEHIHFFKNMEGRDFLRLLYNSKCLIGNSSVGIRECAYMGVPVVNIGSRQNGRDRGQNVIDVDYNSENIKSAILSSIQKERIKDFTYGGGNAGKQMADIIATTELDFKKILQY